MNQETSQQWGPDKFFQTEEEWLRYYESEQKEKVQRVCTKGLLLTSLKALLAEPEENTDWIVDGLLPKGGLSVIIAKPKTGKSTLARQLALCVSRGEEFLSRETAKGLAIYLAFEERRRDVQSHFKIMGTVGDEELKVFAGMAPVDAIALVREMATNEKPVLIVVDTLARLARISDLNDYAKVTAGLEPILAIARECGSHVCLLHHARKGDSKGIDAALGSTGITGTVDTIIQIYRTEKYRTISSIQRIGQDIEETVLEFDNKRRWASLGGSREQAEIDRVKTAIIDFLQVQDDAVEEKTIGEGIEATKSYRIKALRQLVCDGIVERLGEGKRGNPYLYKKAGFVVRNISYEPENQNPKNKITPDNHTYNSGSCNLKFFDSGSQNIELEERAAIMEFDGGLSRNDAVKAATAILKAEAVS